jgi:hypothetical protein
METFHTGQQAPATGTYRFAGHVTNTACQPTEEEKKIPLTYGETFPPCRHCENAALWTM